jgi:hypothetical protein
MSGKVRVEWAAGERHVVWSDLAGRLAGDGQNEEQRRKLKRIAQALSRIARMRDDDGRVLVDLPIMYPSGAMVVVEVEINRGKCFVSDMGGGLVEAEFAAAQSYYTSAANEAAEDFAVSFDGHSTFTLWVPETAAESAVVCVANASRKAASEAVRRAADEKMTLG